MITDIEEIQTACAGGATITMVMPDVKKLNDLPTYHLSTTSEEIGTRVFQRLKLEPVIDGLFPKGPSQNYTLEGIY